MIHIIQRRAIWLSISGIMVVVGVASLMLWQLKFGIDFTGGSLLEVSYSNTRPSHVQLQEAFDAVGLKEVEMKDAEGTTEFFRFKTVDEATHQKLLNELKKGDKDLIERSFQSVGPLIGEELKWKSITAVIIALLMILAYITIVFRKVSYPVASWKYGISAILALFHDLLFVVGIFALLGHFAGIEIESTFIPAFLTVLGFSVHDTIVVFDRIRENLTKYRGDFEEIVEKSINETIVRSVNTSLTVLLVLFMLYLFGGETIKNFALALFLGIGVGTYSSIFVASPLLVVWHEWTQGKKNTGNK